jgi:hypothetical protein
MADKPAPARDPHLGVFELCGHLVNVLSGMIATSPQLAGFTRSIAVAKNMMENLRAELYPEVAVAAQKAIDDAEVEALAQAKVKAAQAATTPQQVNDLLEQHSATLAASAAASAEAADANAAATKEAADKAAALDAAATARAKEILAVDAPPAADKKPVPAKVAA